MVFGPKISGQGCCRTWRSQVSLLPACISKKISSLEGCETRDLADLFGQEAFAATTSWEMWNFYVQPSFLRNSVQLCTASALPHMEMGAKLILQQEWLPEAWTWPPTSMTTLFIATSELPKRQQQNWTEHVGQAQGKGAARASGTQLQGSKEIHSVPACDLACRKVRVSCISHCQVEPMWELLMCFWRKKAFFDLLVMDLFY